MVYFPPPYYNYPQLHNHHTVTATKQNTRQGLRSSYGNYVELQGKEKRKEEEGLQRVCTF